MIRETNFTYVIDTNILLYAFDYEDEKKQKIAKNILHKVFSGEIEAIVTSQIIAEFSVVARKLKKPLSTKEIQQFISSIKNNFFWHIIPYNSEHVLRANSYKTHFWDALIAETVKKYNYPLITENESDFKQTGIKTINPFK